MTTIDKPYWVLLAALVVGCTAPPTAPAAPDTDQDDDDSSRVVEGGPPIALFSATASNADQIGQTLQVLHSCPAGVCPSATFDGSSSIDPLGRALEYSWNLSSPDGSSATLDPSNLASADTPMDLPGSYTATLVVTNSDGEASAPCSAEVTALWFTRLRLELSWTLEGDDLDLHVLRPDPPGALRTDGDCYWENCSSRATLDWGRPGVSDDDPSFDLNDTVLGPENFTIEPGLPPHVGWYRVYVHDQPDSGGAEPNLATVRIYADGVLQESVEVTIEGEGEDFGAH